MVTEVLEEVDGVEELPEVPEFPDVRVSRRFVIQRDGKDYVLFHGLVDMLHQLSEGYFDVGTNLVQVPTQENGQTAIVTARVVVFDPTNMDVVRRVASGTGDASPANVTKLMAPHLIRMAETRAVARALRLLTNVGMTAFEELGPPDDERRFAPPPTAERQAAPPERTQGQEERPDPHDRIQVQGQIYTRDQVWATYQARMLEARRAGLAVPDDQNGLKKDAPLSAMVAASQEVRKRLTARNGTDAS